MRAAREKLQFPESGGHKRIPHQLQPHWLAGAEGFEPSNTGSKVPRLTAWPRPTRCLRAMASYRGFEHFSAVCEEADLRSGLNAGTQTVSLYDGLGSLQVVDRPRD